MGFILWLFPFGLKFTVFFEILWETLIRFVNSSPLQNKTLVKNCSYLFPAFFCSQKFLDSPFFLNLYCLYLLLFLFGTLFISLFIYGIQEKIKLHPEKSNPNQLQSGKISTEVALVYAISFSRLVLPSAFTR